MMVTDEMVSLALCANVDLIQGFTYEARHVIRDFRVDYKKGVEVWSGPRGTHDEMMKRIEFLKMRASLEAALTAQPQSLPGCLHPGSEINSCRHEGQCLSAACNHNGKTWYGARMTLEAQVDGVLYPEKTIPTSGLNDVNETTANYARRKELKP